MGEPQFDQRAHALMRRLRTDPLPMAQTWAKLSDAELLSVATDFVAKVPPHINESMINTRYVWKEHLKNTAKSAGSPRRFRDPHAYAFRLMRQRQWFKRGYQAALAEADKRISANRPLPKIPKNPVSHAEVEKRILEGSTTPSTKSKEAHSPKKPRHTKSTSSRVASKKKVPFKSRSKVETKKSSRPSLPSYDINGKVGDILQILKRKNRPVGFTLEDPDKILDELMADNSKSRVKIARETDDESDYESE